MPTLENRHRLSAVNLALAMAFGCFSSPAWAQPTASPAPVQLETVTVEERRSQPPFGTSLNASDLRTKRFGSNDTAALLEVLPGVASYTGGGVSSLPVIHGLGDDRLRVAVDGMAILSACPNHMNPPLSYLDPSALESVRVFAGIVPVSQGGDSIGSSVSVTRAAPQFASGNGWQGGGKLGFFARDNGNVLALNLQADLATERLYLSYTGNTASANNYHDAQGNVVVASGYKVRNNALRLATKSDTGLVTLDMGWQDLPLQGFPNQPMDMVFNKSASFNLGFKGGLGAAAVEARVFRQRVRHKMDILADKSSGHMPMDTDATDLGFSVVVTQAGSEAQSLRWGHDYHRYSLDDWWPALSGFMAPHDFWNIHGGKRERFALFAEADQQWGSRLSSQVGMRWEQVAMDAGAVQGYHSAADGSYTTMMGSKRSYGDAAYQLDANAFNAKPHRRRDQNWDLTAALRLVSSEIATYDVGISRKSRSPNLHERYAWSNESMMAGLMNNWFGDLNAYVGNLNLKPEVAYTVKLQADWHDPENKDWQITLAPFLAKVRDYVNAAPNMSANMYSMMAMRRSLQFVNEAVSLTGMDASGYHVLQRATHRWTVRGSISAVRGRTDAGDNLYNIMPPNARLALEHAIGPWQNSLSWQAVAAKHRVSQVRDELPTAGYSLVHLRTSYQWSKQLQLDATLNNALNRQYSLPLGGLEFAGSNKLRPTRGAGRALTLGFTASF